MTGHPDPMTVPIVPGQPPITTGHGMIPHPLRPPPRKTGMSPAMIALLVTACVAVGFVGLVVLGAVLRAGAAGNAPTGEITITSCGATAADNVMAEVRVENKSKTDKTYAITVEFVEGNERLGTGHVYVSHLHPGQSTKEEAIALHQSTGHFTCRISDVSRY